MAKNIYNSSEYYDLLTVSSMMGSLPSIRGQWFFVDPLTGSDTTGDGQQISTAFASLPAAYAACTDGNGDGICLLSSGSTTASTTSYLVQTLVWAKNGITLFGVSANNGIYQRARVASKDITSSTGTAHLTFTTTTATRSDAGGSFIADGWVIGMTGVVASTGGTSANNGVTFTVTGVTALTLSASAAPFTADATPTSEVAFMYSYIAQLVSITSANNLFQNVSFENVGAQAQAIGGIILTGAQRNQFNNVFVYGGGGCTAVATTRSLEIGARSDENYFFDSTIGTDTVDRGNYANAEIYINADTTTGRNYFYNCWILSMTSTGTAHGAIKSAGAAAYGRHLLFENCVFVNYTPNLGADQTSLFIGTGFNTAKILLVNTSICGYAYADSSTTNKCVYTQGGPTILTTGLGGVMVTKTT